MLLMPASVRRVAFYNSIMPQDIQSDQVVVMDKVMSFQDTAVARSGARHAVVHGIR